MKTLITGFFLAFFWTVNMAANLVWEGEIADSISAGVAPEQVIWLGQSPNQYLTLHLPAVTWETRGGVILLHDTGGNPDHKDVIRPLRTALPEKGWETLSIQLPLAGRHDSIDEFRAQTPAALQRIQLAVDFFTVRQNRNLILIGHGLGAEMGQAYLFNTPSTEVRAFVAIGMAATQSQPARGSLEMPMLDLLGSREQEEVLRHARLRASAARRSGWTQYRQDRITGAAHDFRGLTRNLLIQVGAWLGKAAAGMETSGSDLPNPTASTP